MDATDNRDSPLRLYLTAEARALLLTTKNGTPAGAGAHDDTQMLLSVPEVAKRLSMGRSYVQTLVSRGEIASIKLGKSRRVAVRALEAYIARLESEQSENGTAPP